MRQRTWRLMRGLLATALLVTGLLQPRSTGDAAELVLKDGRILEAAATGEVRRIANREVIEILSRVLSEAATYDTDILDLLEE